MWASSATPVQAAPDNVSLAYLSSPALLPLAKVFLPSISDKQRRARSCSARPPTSFIHRYYITESHVADGLRLEQSPALLLMRSR